MHSTRKVEGCPKEVTGPDGVPSSQAAAVMASLQESRDTVSTECTKPGDRGTVISNDAAKDLSQGVKQTQQRKETEQLLEKTQLTWKPPGLPGSQAAALTANLHNSEEVGTKEAQLPRRKERMKVTDEKVSLQAKEATSSEEDISSGDENPGEGVGSDLLMTKPESTLQHKDNGTLAARRNRKQKWEPPEGMRTCGQKYTGCAAKCASMGQEECSSCQINRVKETSKKYLSKSRTMSKPKGTKATGRQV